MQRRLEQYLYIKRELRQLQEDMINAGSLNARDIVTGSMNAWPYIPQAFHIEGVDNAKLKRLNRRYTIKRYKLMQEKTAIEDFIESIDDSVVRQIIELKYIKGYTWGMVATKVYGYPCESTVRMKLKRFFEEK